MSRGKKILAVGLCVLILAAAAGGVMWHLQHYHLIDFRFYAKDAQMLDLRQEEISSAHYEKIRRKMPDCRILWNVPFQGQTHPQDIRVLRVEALTEEDLDSFAFFEALEQVDAGECRDYALLQRLQQRYPDLKVDYAVTIGEKSYAPGAEKIFVDGLTAEDIASLQFLPYVTSVCIESGKDPEQLAALAEYCRGRNISFRVMLGGKGYSADTRELTVEKFTDEEAALLQFLPELTKLHLKEPQLPAQDLFSLIEENPRMAITWEKEVLGVLFDGDTEQLDLTEALSPEGAYAYEQAKKAPVQGDRDEITYLFAADSDYPLPDKTAFTQSLIEQVEQALAYFPNARMVEMCGSILDNEAMAAFRENHREDYKVVWSVQCGKMIARTDTPYFMPTKYHVYYFQDHESGNLKYCEDMVCVDLGHMSIKHIEWAAYMPKLEYLILAHSDVRSIDPIVNCKKLKFLELDWSAVKDFTPLKELTLLEDLNLGNTYGNFDVIGEMTWLKNLWMVGCSRGAASKMVQTLTETKVNVSGNATVAGGWRELPNYYAMRDIMGMYYMIW